MRGQLTELTEYERCPPGVTNLFRACTAVDPAARPDAGALFRALEAAG